MNSFIITEEEKKRIIDLHESRTKSHYLMEEVNDDEKDCNELCNLFYDGKCLSLDEFTTDVSNKIKKWYKEKYSSPEHRWFFNLKLTDPDVKELYNMYKMGEDWTELDEMIFFYELAMEHCNDNLENHIENELEHPCKVSKKFMM
jgi:hypothetical protein